MYSNSVHHWSVVSTTNKERLKDNQLAIWSIVKPMASLLNLSYLQKRHRWVFHTQSYNCSVTEIMSSDQVAPPRFSGAGRGCWRTTEDVVIPPHIKSEIGVSCVHATVCTRVFPPLVTLCRCCTDRRRVFEKVLFI